MIGYGVRPFRSAGFRDKKTGFGFLRPGLAVSVLFVIKNDIPLDQMAITQEQYKAAYNFAKEVHSGRISLSSARAQLNEAGFKKSTAVVFVNALRHMLRGKVYKRALNEPATDFYLHSILRDYGVQAHNNALCALEQHISYYCKKRGVHLPGLRKVLQKHTKIMENDAEFFLSPEEAPDLPETLMEGRCRTVPVNIHERNSRAREICIQKYGTACSVCNFDFSIVYGLRGRGFIHVHHLQDIASIRKEYVVDPENDLRPVCPNCHAMLHVKPALTIEQLKKLVQAQKASCTTDVYLPASYSAQGCGRGALLDSPQKNRRST